MMKTFKFALAGAAAFVALGAAQDAKAEVISYGLFELTNIGLFSGGAGSTDLFEGLSAPANQPNNTAGTSAQITGVGFDSDGDSQTGLGPLNVDPAMACVGNCGGIPENTFESVVFAPDIQDQAADFSRADSQLVGQIDSPTFLDSRTVVETRIADGTASSSEASTGSNGTVQFNFVMADSGTITIRFDALLDLQIVTTDPVESSTVETTFTVQLTTGDDVTVVELEPEPLNQNIQVGQNLTTSYSFSDTLEFSADLAAGEYSLALLQSVRQISTSGEIQVPEPGTLGLLGGGLALLGGFGVRRRRRAGSA